MFRFRNLLEGTTCEARTIPENVPVPGEHDKGHAVLGRSGPVSTPGTHELTVRVERVGRLKELALERNDHLHIIDTTEIARTRGLGRLRVNGKGVAVDESIGDVGVELVRLDKTEVTTLTISEPGKIVKVKGDGFNRVLVVFTAKVEVIVQVFLTLPADSPDQLNNGVVKVQVDGNGLLVGRMGNPLHLANQLLERTSGEHVTLIKIKMDIGGIEPRL